MKTILLTLAFFCTHQLVFSQQFFFGASVGGNLTAINLVQNKSSSFELNKYEPLISPGANLFLSYKTKSLLGFTIEPGYIQKGGIQKYDPTFKVTELFNYINIPLSVDVYATDKLFFSIGPELNFLVNAKAKSGDNINDNSQYYDQKFDLAGMVSISYGITNFLDITLRANHSFIPYTNEVFTNSQGELIADIDYYHRYAQLAIRYKFKLL